MQKLNMKNVQRREREGFHLKKIHIEECYRKQHFSSLPPETSKPEAQ